MNAAAVMPATGLTFGDRLRLVGIAFIVLGAAAAAALA